MERNMAAISEGRTRDVQELQAKLGEEMKLLKENFSRLQVTALPPKVETRGGALPQRPVFEDLEPMIIRAMRNVLGEGEAAQKPQPVPPPHQIPSQSPNRIEIGEYLLPLDDGTPLFPIGGATLPRAGASMPMAHPSHSSQNPTFIRPVGARAIPPTQNPAPLMVGPLMVNPIQSILAGGLEIPHFVGTKVDWKQYERDLEAMFASATSINGTPLTDSQKLALLDLTLDPISKKKLRVMRSQGQPVTFASFWAGMKIEFDSSNTNFARARWEGVTCRNLGNVSFEDWREFETEFLAAWADVHDATEEEAYKLLIPKIPHRFRDEVFQNDMKRFGSKPLVYICNIGDFTSEEAKVAIRRFTKGIFTPSRVEKIAPEVYHVQVENLLQAQILTCLDKQVTAESRRVIEARILERHMLTREVLEFVRLKIQAKELSNTWGKVGQSNLINDPKATRVREAVIKGETAEGGAVKDDKEPKAPPKVSPPPTNGNTSPTKAHFYTIEFEQPKH
jgi:hypothetical protein